MTVVKLHQDWPEYNTALRSWDNEGPAAEIASAFDDYPSFVSATAPQSQVDPIAFDDIDSVISYHVRSHEAVWAPGASIGTELEMVLLGKLKDGRHFTLSAWNDYTGWGCQSGATFTIGDTIEAVTAYGLDERERNMLAITLSPVAPKVVES